MSNPWSKLTRNQRKGLMFHVLYGGNSTLEQIRKAVEFIDGDDQVTEPIVVGPPDSIPKYCQHNCKTEGPPGPIWCTQCGHAPSCCNCEEWEGQIGKSSLMPIDAELGQRFLDVDIKGDRSCEDKKD